MRAAKERFVVQAGELIEILRPEREAASTPTHPHFSPPLPPNNSSSSAIVCSTVAGVA